MLIFSFFVAGFVSFGWVMYMTSFLSIKLVGVSIASLGLMDLAIYTALVVLPILVVWTIWGQIFQLINYKNSQKQMLKLFSHIKQNSEYSDIIARILVQKTNNSSNEFVINKIDFFVSEMNESLFDILQRHKLVAQEELDKIWIGVEKGNKWGFAKTVIELNNNDNDFEKKLCSAATKNQIITGAIREFCSRYTRLINLLKTHDKEKIYLDVIETGAFGRVFAIFAPMVDNLQKSSYTKIEPKAEKTQEALDNLVVKDLEAQIEVVIEPRIEKAEEKIVAVVEQKESTEEAKEESKEENKEEVVIKEEGFFATIEKKLEEEKITKPKKSKNKKKKAFLPKIPKLGDIISKNKEVNEIEPQYGIDSFSMALERSFGKLSDADKIKNDEDSSKPTNDKFAFASTEKTLKNLQKEWEEIKQLDKKPDEENKEKDKEEVVDLTEELEGLSEALGGGKWRV